MQSIHALTAPFRYLWRFRPDGEAPSDLAATNVLVTTVDPALLGEKTLAQGRNLVARSELVEAGEISLDDFGERGSGRIRDLLRSVIQPVLGERGIRYLAADYGLICGGATGFHHDMPCTGAVYIAWHLEGPDRVLHFPEMGLKIPFTKGTFVIFDPAQPHGLLKAGTDEFDPADYDSAEFVQMLGAQTYRYPKTRKSLGIEPYGVRKHSKVRTTPEQYTVCPRTGRIPGLPV